MNKKKAVNGLLIGLSVLLVAGMAYQFTPNVGELFNRQTGTPALKVNGRTVTVEEIEAVRNGNQALASLNTGVLGDDAKILLTAQMIDRAAILGAVEDVNVERSEIDKRVDEIRKSNQLTDNAAWTDALQRMGSSDAEFRKDMRSQIAFELKSAELRKAVPAPTEAELRAYFDLNREKYRTEEQIVGRQIVVSDRAKAEGLLAQAKAGANFAQLASANSEQNKDRGGALAPLDNGVPRPVLRAALPTPVADAAFALTQGGLTGVIESAGKYVIVKVEKFVPGQLKTFDQAKADVTNVVRTQKENAALEKWTDGLRQGAKVEYIDPAWKIQNPTVASVAGKNIPYSEVVSQMLTNPQISGLLGQLPPDQAAPILNASVKPGIVQQLMDSYAAPNVASKLGLSLTGSRGEIAQQLAAYGSRGVTVSDAEVLAFYQENKGQFEIPASATLDEAVFKDKNQAAAFRADWNGQGDFVAAATKAGGIVSERGQVSPDTQNADPKLVAAVFADGLRPVGEGSLTPVVQTGQNFSIGYVRELQRASTQPLEAVGPQIREQLLATKQAEAGQGFLAKQVATLNPKNNLTQVLEAQAKRVAAAEPKPQTPAGGAPASGTPGTPAPGANPAAGGASDAAPGSEGTGAAGEGTAPAQETAPANEGEGAAPADR
ncbi:peptidyl-prolyl cis-trans isomerase [Deinococcus reticulitermitis]|uniref:peptidyl-prolyl cis-trans isomerase n=1 Tax=Deinococcus reticulitermitis TaxID=856736 RepID=UPI001160443F|nr:peptidyl-prolyl cis-trans isomerase [Deinococcus reticulitermitis]